MANRIFNVIIASLMVMALVVSSTKVIYAGQPDVEDLASSYRIQIKSGDRTEEYVVQEIIDGYNRGLTNAGLAANILVNQNGMLTEYVDDFRAAGITIDDNGSSTNSPKSNTTSQPKQKTEFTVEDVEPYTAWTTKNCNIRSGADTTYDKVGSLKKFEEVKVTGKASTGWCRITTSSGAEAYISNSLLTTEDPKTVTVQTSEKSDEVVTTVEGEKPSTAAQVVDEIKAEEASEEPKEEPKEEELTYTSEITKETTCTEKGIITYTSENGDSYTEEIPMLEHVPGDWEVSKEPSLTKDGEKVKKCTVCGEILETQKIPAKTNVLIGLIIACVVAIGGCIAGVVLYKKQKKD
jgi:uncharacterized protein YgiM (DUF1202 family)